MDSRRVSSVVLLALERENNSYETSRSLGSLQVLPENVLGGVIASFLDPASLTRLSSTCRLLRSHSHSPLPVYVHHKLPNRENMPGPHDYRRFEYADLGTTVGAIDRILVRLDGFCDQGWGNRKGLLIFEIERSCASEHGGVNKILFQSFGPYYLAQHLESPTLHELSGVLIALPLESFEGRSLGRDSKFSYLREFRQGDHLRVSFIIGDGGGHRITIRNLNITLIVRPAMRLRQIASQQVRLNESERPAGFGEAWGYGNILLQTYDGETLCPGIPPGCYERFTADDRELNRSRCRLKLYLRGGCAWGERNFVTIGNMLEVLENRPSRAFFALNPSSGEFAPSTNPTVFELVQIEAVPDMNPDAPYFTRYWFLIKEAASTTLLSTIESGSREASRWSFLGTTVPSGSTITKDAWFRFINI